MFHHRLTRKTLSHHREACLPDLVAMHPKMKMKTMMMRRPLHRHSDVHEEGCRRLVG
jgi:hypothetical protein